MQRFGYVGAILAQNEAPAETNASRTGDFDKTAQSRRKTSGMLTRKVPFARWMLGSTSGSR